VIILLFPIPQNDQQNAPSPVPVFCDQILPQLTPKLHAIVPIEPADWLSSDAMPVFIETKTEHLDNPHFFQFSLRNNQQPSSPFQIEGPLSTSEAQHRLLSARPQATLTLAEGTYWLGFVPRQYVHHGTRLTYTYRLFGTNQGKPCSIDVPRDLLSL